MTKRKRQESQQKLATWLLLDTQHFVEKKKLSRTYLHDFVEKIKKITVKESKEPRIQYYIEKRTNKMKEEKFGKKDGQLHEIKPQPDICSRDHAHKNVSCSTCHSSWTSKCIGCHNQFDTDEKMAYDLLDKKYVEGQWKEFESNHLVLEVSENLNIDESKISLLLNISAAFKTSIASILAIVGK